MSILPWCSGMSHNFLLYVVLSANVRKSGSNYISGVCLCHEHVVHSRRDTCPHRCMVCRQQLWRIHCFAFGIWNWPDRSPFTSLAVDVHCKYNSYHFITPADNPTDFRGNYESLECCNLVWPPRYHQWRQFSHRRREAICRRPRCDRRDWTNRSN